MGTEAEAQHRLEQQIQFVVEADKAKHILRRNLLTDGSREENDAEHSWHLALMAVVLVEYARGPDLDLLKVIIMVLIHDLIEIDAGDTFVYDEAANVGKLEREIVAADRIFNLLPGDAARELRALWDEFEARQSPEARFAAALDRLHPMLLNYHAGGGAWKRHGVSGDRVRAKNCVIESGAPALWQYASTMIDAAEARGFIPATDAAPEN